MSQAIHILVIEDDPAVGASLQEALARDGYTVTWKNTGMAGVAFARDHQPHLIVLDIRLPDGSGFDFCSQMRRMRLRQPIVMLTARRDEVDKIVGLEVGADDYVTKPYSISELRSRIRAQIRRAYGELAPVESDLLYAGDLVIDRGRGQVSRGDDILRLTPTELRLLVTLVQHRGQVLSRQQLLDTVWGYSGEYENEKTVTVHIRRLREKIEPDANHPTLILTVPGLGYRFSET